MIGRMTACQDHRSMIGDVHPVLAEILGRDAFHVDKGPEINLQVVLFRKIVVGGFVRLRLRLCNENGFYFQGRTNGNFQTVCLFIPYGQFSK